MSYPEKQNSFGTTLLSLKSKVPQGDYLPDFLAWSDDMAKVTYEYDPIEDNLDLLMHQKANEMYNALFDIQSETRKFDKHSNWSEGEMEQFLKFIYEHVSIIHDIG